MNLKVIQIMLKKTLTRLIFIFVFTIVLFAPLSNADAEKKEVGDGIHKILASANDDEEKEKLKKEFKTEIENIIERELDLKLKQKELFESVLEEIKKKREQEKVLKFNLITEIGLVTVDWSGYTKNNSLTSFLKARPNFDIPFLDSVSLGGYIALGKIENISLFLYAWDIESITLKPLTLGFSLGGYSSDGSIVLTKESNKTYTDDEGVTQNKVVEEVILLDFNQAQNFNGAYGEMRLGYQLDDDKSIFAFRRWLSFRTDSNVTQTEPYLSSLLVAGINFTWVF